jgi:hypothetical protein
VNLKTVFRPFSDAAVVEGTVTEQMRSAHDRAVRDARLEFARRQAHWTELAEGGLVRRGASFLVDSDDDAVYVLRRGHVFEPGRATIGYIPDNTAMTFYVDQADNIVFVERYSGAATWSEIVARRARRGAT